MDILETLEHFVYCHLGSYRLEEITILFSEDIQRPHIWQARAGI